MFMVLILIIIAPFHSQVSTDVVVTRKSLISL